MLLIQSPEDWYKDLEITGRVETSNYSIIDIGQNTEKSTGDLTCLSLKFQWKTIR